MRVRVREYFSYYYSYVNYPFYNYFLNVLLQRWSLFDNPQNCHGVRSFPRYCYYIRYDLIPTTVSTEL